MKSRVLILGSTYPLSQSDPQVPWLRETVKRLRAQEIEVEVLAPAYCGSKSHWIDDVRVNRFRYAPSALEDLTHGSGAPNNLQSKARLLLTIPYLICGTLALLYLCHKFRPQCIHVHWPLPHGLMALFAKLLYKIPILATCHGAEFALARRHPAYTLALKLALASSDILHANSSHTKEQISAVCKRSVTVLPYGATISLRQQVKEPFSEPRQTRLLTCGRHVERKGLIYLIDAMPTLLQKDSFHLWITGEGILTPSLKKRAMELNLNNHITFCGFVSDSDLSDLYATCDIYVHPSIIDSNGDTEGLGVVLVEALMQRRPVVASSVGGIVDVIQHEKTGLLVPPADLDALIAAILRLSQDIELARRLGQQGQEFCQVFFDWDKIIARLTQDLRRFH